MKRKAHPPRGARLFGEPQQPTDTHIANVDGAARGNPGPASYAVIIRAPDGRVVFQLGKYLGHATNNVAEYYGLISALDYAAGHGIRRLRVRSDSELLVQQMKGRYKVKSATLAPLHERAQKLARGLEYFSVEHVRRELNKEADKLANEALDATPGVAPAFSSSHSSDRKSGGPKAAAAKRIRAVYRDGKLHPAEPLDLAEGDELDIIIHKAES